jgi:hypothetical protein
MFQIADQRGTRAIEGDSVICWRVWIPLLPALSGTGTDEGTVYAR